MKLNYKRFFIGIIVLIIVLANGFGDIISNYIDRSITTYIAVPVILIYYYINSKHSDYVYMLSFVFTFLGMTYFNISTNTLQPIGIVFYGIALLIYIYKLIENTEVFSLKMVLYFALPFSIVAITIMYLLLKDLDENMFLTVAFYSMLVSVFFYISVFNYRVKQNAKTLKLLISGILLTISAICSGYNYFIDYKLPFRVLEVFTLTFFHFFMCLYMVDVSKLKDNIKI